MFFRFVNFIYHANVVSSVSYVLYVCYFIYRLVGIAFFDLFGFRNSFIFLLFSKFKSANFREMYYVFTVMSCWLWGWAFVVGFSYKFIALSASSFFWFLFRPFFRSCPVYTCIFYFVYRFFFDIFLSVRC